MKSLRILGVGLAFLLVAAAPARNTLYGFTPSSSAAEHEAEDRFLDIPSAQGALDAAGVIGAKPHYAGTPADYQLALYMRDKLREYGFTTELETLTARVDTPKELVLELYPTGTPPQYEASTAVGVRLRKSRTTPKLIGPPPIDFDLREVPEPSDPDTKNPAIGLPFNAGSADGNLIAPLVYASRGLEADYAALAAHNVDVAGAVVIVRYGAQFRGNLAKRAQAHGARGVIFYSDPAEDGAARGAVYPNGPWRPGTAIQRGSVGEGVTIPTLPISSNNARTLIAALRGPSGAKPWAGALGVRYPYGRGPAAVHLHVALTRKVTTLWNTIGIMRGAGPQTVMLGAHRDAWVSGVGDDGSGIVTMLEVARGYSYLAKSGWTPKRSIVIAGWDGGEIGEAGSIAYVKRHSDDIRADAIAYLNADKNVTGPRFGADAAAAIASTIVDVVHDVPDPSRLRTSVYERWATERRPIIAIPGGGSDHEPFLFTIGTPAANIGFNGPYGVYHSSYDTVRYATLFSDPTFALHRAAAQIYGVVGMRLASADVIPYRFSAYVPLMRGTIATLAARARTMKVAIDVRGLQSSVNAFARAAARFDTLTSRAQTDGTTDREIEAAQTLDLAAYSADGYPSLPFPELTRGLDAGTPAAFDVASTRVRGAIDHAAALLVR